MIFSVHTYIDTTTFAHAALFEGIEQIWEVLPRIDAYIASLFANGKVTGNYKDQKDVYVGEGTVIHDGVRIEGPVVIGKNCLITHGAYIRAGCLLGDNVRIGHGAEIKHSIFLDRSVAAHLNYVGDSIVGNNVNISGGAMIANFRLDKAPVIIKHEGQTHETHLEKFGAVLGDNVNVGANAVINPGTLLGKGALVYPLTSVRGVHIENDRVR